MAPPSRSNPQSPTTFAPESFDHSNRRISFPGAPVQYRIEERRRTVYVRATAPPSEWDQQTMDGILGLAQSAEPNDASEHMIDQDFFLSRHWTPQTPGSEIRDAGPDSPYGSPTTPTQRSLGAYTRPRLLFYHSHDPHYGFTNFSPHPVLYQGRRYPTSEHLFQSFKVRCDVRPCLQSLIPHQFEHRPNLAEHIRTCSERPSVAFAEARRFAPEVRPDWMEANIAKVNSLSQSGSRCLCSVL
jgi:predicted NAD-dependent protein-ADP-ribosyltransferase YbiA (DUF1768 family)